VVANTLRFYRSTHTAASTGAYRLLTAAGAARLAARARLRGDRGLSAYWTREARLHLARHPDTDTGL
jgi:hypothetical protein